jgi:hypothetical protein
LEKNRQRIIPSIWRRPYLLRLHRKTFTGVEKHTKIDVFIEKYNHPQVVRSTPVRG